MVTIGKDWVLWRPKVEVSVHIDWACQQLRVSVGRKGDVVSTQFLPLPAAVEARFVTVTEHRVMLTLHTNDSDVECQVSYFDKVGLRIRGLGFLLDVDLKEGQ